MNTTFVVLQNLVAQDLYLENGSKCSLVICMDLWTMSHHNTVDNVLKTVLVSEVLHNSVDIYRHNQINLAFSSMRIYVTFNQAAI